MTNERTTTTTNGAPVSGASRSFLLARAVPGFGRTVSADRAERFRARSGYGLSATVQWIGAATHATGADRDTDALWKGLPVCPSCWTMKSVRGICGCDQ